MTRIHKDLKPFTVLHTFTQHVACYADSIITTSSSDGTLYQQNMYGGIPSPNTKEGLSLDNATTIPSHLMLILSSRRERTPSLRLPSSFRPLLSRLGIFPSKTLFSISSFFFVENGPLLSYYKQRYATFDDLEEASNDPSNPRHSEAARFFSRYGQSAHPFHARFPFITSTNTEYIRTNPLVDRSWRSRFTMFFNPMDVYLNLRLLAYDPDSMPAEPHPLCRQTFLSLSPSEQEQLMFPFGHSSLLQSHHHCYYPHIIGSFSDSTMTFPSHKRTFRYHSRYGESFFRFTPETPFLIDPTPIGQRLLSLDLRFDDHYQCVPYPPFHHPPFNVSLFSFPSLSL